MPNPPITNSDVVTLKAGEALIVSPLSNDVLDPGTAWAADNPVTVVPKRNLLIYTQDLNDSPGMDGDPADNNGTYLYVNTGTLASTGPNNPFQDLTSTELVWTTSLTQNFYYRGHIIPETPSWKIDHYWVLSYYVKKAPVGPGPSYITLNVWDYPNTPYYNNAYRFQWAGDAPTPDTAFNVHTPLTGSVESVGDGWYRVSIAVEGLGKVPAVTLQGDSAWAVLQSYKPNTDTAHSYYMSSPQLEQHPSTFTTLNLLYPEHVFPVGSGAPSGGMWASTIGQATENSRVVKTTPHNTDAVVWETINQDTADDGEGGSNGTYFDIDNTKTYRFSIWVRKQFEDLSEGKVYFGLHGLDAASNFDAIIGVADGSVYANPYFFGSTNMPSYGTDIDDYHLFVGYVSPHDFVGTTNPHTDRGWWRRDGTQVLGGIYPNDGYGTEYKWTTATTKTHLRFYHYYNINPPAGETVDFFGPRVDLVDGTEPTITELIAGTGTYTPSAYQPVPTAPPVTMAGTAVADADTGAVTFTSTGSVASTETFWYTATDSNGLVSTDAAVTVDITGSESAGPAPPVAGDITLSSGALLKYRATPLGLGVSVTANPTTVRNKSVRLHLELSGGTGGGSNVTVAVEGRAAAAAPWYRIAEVVGSWQTPSSSQVKANTDGSYAFETVAFPEMRAKLLSFSGGTAVQAASTTSIALLSNPSAGDWVSMDDAFGITAKFVFYSGTDLPTGDGDIPILIGVDSGTTGLALLGAIRLEAAKHRINIDAVGGSQDTRIDCTHKVPGTTGNSSSITFSPASGTFFTSPLSGGTGTDTYTSVWLDA